MQFRSLRFPVSWDDVPILSGLLLPEDADMPLGEADELGRGPGKQDPALIEDDQTVADGLDVLDDMGGQQDQAVLGCLGEQVAEMDPFFRVQPYGGLVQDQERPPDRARIRVLAWRSRLTAERAFLTAAFGSLSCLSAAI